MTQDVRRLNEQFAADVRQAMKAARISRELADEPVRQRYAETLARVAGQRHAACHELTVAQQRIEQLEIQAYRRGTAIICLLLALAAAMVVALWR